ncbi:MAG: methyltransferase domain-containing protein [Ignavibacteriae bacterium]|nr:methyltransferase domain-containing protein [Ignavibacteriota bacterium]
MKEYLNNDFDFVKYIDVADELSIWSAPFGLKLLDYVEYRTNISVLDIGFGVGFPLTELALRLGNTSTIYGIDPWKETFERVNKKIDYYRIKNVKLIEGIAESIPLDTNSIDLITSNNGINNVTDIDKVLTECSRVMKLGGQFVQTLNTDLSMIEFYNELEKVLDELNMPKEIELMRQHISHKRPSIDRLIERIEDNGFVIKDLERNQFNYKFANGTAMLNHYFIRLAFMDSWIRFLPANMIEQIFGTIELRLNNLSKEFGGIKLSIPFVLINAIKK